MYNCIFTAHCIETFCDKSCPILAETSYLLERNNLQPTNPVFNASTEKIEKAMKLLDNNEQTLIAYEVGAKENTVYEADLLTYCAICKYWKGSQLHCTVYNLKYSKYLDELRKSWKAGESEELQYAKIWSETAKVLIISNTDYVSFSDFESQTLLNLIQQRQSDNLTTIVVRPYGGGIRTTNSNKFVFTSMLQELLDKAAPIGGET